MHKKRISQRLFSIIVTSVILILLILMGPIQALNISSMTDKPSYTVGETIELTVDVDIESDEVIPFTGSEIKIFGIDPSNSGFESFCVLSDLSKGNHPECNSQDSKFQTVVVEYNNVNYEHDADRQANFDGVDYSWGYGYGYGYNEMSPGKITIRIQWSLPIDWSSGNYKVDTKIKTEQDLFGTEREFPASTQFLVSNIGGKIAFLCRNGGYSYQIGEPCNYGIESDLISWLEQQGWDVEAKASDEWTQKELELKDLIMCSDELMACKVNEGSAAFNAHKNGIPFVEVGDYNYLSAAYRFDYIKNYIGSINDQELFITQLDPITDGYSGSEEVIPSESKMTVISDYYLEPDVVDLADSGQSNEKSTLFKVGETEFNGRYAYIGWFYDSSPNELTSAGEELLERVISWTQCEMVHGCGVSVTSPDTSPPVAFNGSPTEIQEFSTVELMVESNENAVCKGSVDMDEGYEEMDFIFSGGKTHHEYILTEPLENGNHTIYVRCEDKFGNIADISYSWTFEVDLGMPKKILYLCRDDSCNYNIEDEMIDWFDSEGWEVEGRKYDAWEETDFQDCGLIVCSDELIACKVGPDSLVYQQHKMNGKPFLELADYNYLSSAWRFDYVDSYVGYFTRDQMYITQIDPVTDGLSGYLEVIGNDPRLVLIPDYYLGSDVVDIADVADDNGRSNLFRVEKSDDQGRYAYMGWFYGSVPDELTDEGEMILNRVLNWAVCNDANGC